MLELTIALHTLPEPAPSVGHDLTAFAGRQLDRLRKRARRRFEAARQLAPARLHALRIALKHLRYGVEFLAPLFPPKRVARYLEGLAQAQNAFGFLNDLDVARPRLEAWAEESPGLRSAVAFACGWHAPRYARLRRRALEQAEPLLWGKAPWRKAVAAALSSPRNP